VPTTDPAGGFLADLSALRDAQKKAASARVLSQAQPRLHGSTPKAIAGNPGWKTSSALKACLDAWDKRLKQLSEQVEQLSHNLGTTAGRYEAADKRVAKDLQDSLEGLVPPPPRPKPRPHPRPGHVTIPAAKFSGIYGDLTDTHELPYSEEVSNLAKLANYLVSAGFTKQAAAGIASVVGGESSGNPEQEQLGDGLGAGLGIIQWSPIRTESGVYVSGLQRLHEDGGTFGGNPDHDMATQAQALIRYAQGTVGPVPLDTLAKTTDANQAAVWWSGYEGPEVPGSDERDSLISSILGAMPRAGGSVSAV
jgi:hypothetical protein